MKNLAALVALISLHVPLALACGGTVVFEEEGGGGGRGAKGPGPGGRPGKRPHPAGPATGTTIAAAQATSASSSQGSGEGGVGGEITVVSVAPAIYADCMPAVGPDPMHGSVVVEYENLSSEVGSLDIVRADVIFSSRSEGWVFPIELSPTSSGEIAPGERAAVDHQKVATDLDSSFVCQLCGFPGSVTLHFETFDGGELEASGPFELSCAF